RQHEAETAPWSPRRLAERRKDGIADLQHAGKVHRVQVDPGTVELQGLSTVAIPVLVGERDLGGDDAQRFTPFTEKQKNPGQRELAQPVHEAEIRVVDIPLDQHRETLDHVLVSSPVLGRDPFDEVGVDEDIRYELSMTVLDI